MAQIYRVGKDIFDASTNQKIANPTVLETQYKGATEVNAPNTSVPTGATKILNTAGLQGLNESQIFRQGADIYKLPSVISSDKITGGTAPTIKPVEPSFTDTAPYVAGLDTTTKGLESLVSTALAPTPQEAKVTPITSKITELTGQFQQKPADYQAELDKYGFKTNVQDLQNLNTQIASVKAEYDKISNQVKDSSGLTRIVGGTQGRLARQSAIELGGLSSMAQALQGNVQMAQSIADKTIAIKYEPVEQEIANQKFQLEQVYEQLTRDEKKKADALKITLDERQRLIDEQKTKDADINKLMVAAAGQSAPSNILQEMLKAKTPQEAIVIGRDYLKTFNGYTDLGNGNYVNNTTGTVNTLTGIQQEQNLAQGIVTTSTGDAYDIKSYATDPNHEKSVQSILNGIGKMNTIEDMDRYIKSQSPESPITGQMIANAAGKYGVSWEMMLAIMDQDSNFADPRMNDKGQISTVGARQRAFRTKNPGNVGNVDSGANVNRTSWQDGVDAVAKNLEWRKTTSVATPTTPSDTKNVADAIIAGNAKLTDVPQKDRAAVITEIQKSGKNVAELEQKQATAESTKGEAVSIIDTLLNSKVIGNATGLMSWTTKIPGTGAYSFGRSFDQLRDLLAMDNIDKLKGAMSDKDIEFLRNSATKLALGLPKDEFIAELNKLKLKLQNPTSSINTSAGNSGTTSSGIGYTIE